MSIFGLATGLLGSVGNFFGQRSANQTNRAMQDSANRTNIAMQNSANQANKELAQLGQQHEIDMWNMQNAYNTPEMQMQRMKEAGLNPALMYGQGTTGNASSAPGAHVAQVNSPQVKAAQVKAAQMDLLPALSAFQDWQVKKAQKDNIEAQTRATEEGIINTRLNNQALQARYPYIQQLLDQTLRKGESDISYTDLRRVGQELSNQFDRQSMPTRMQTLTENLKDIIQARKIAKDNFNFQRSLRGLEIDARKGKISQLHLNNAHQQLLNSMFRDTYDNQVSSSNYSLDFLRGKNRLQDIDVRLKSKYPRSGVYSKGVTGNITGSIYHLIQDLFGFDSIK